MLAAIDLALVVDGVAQYVERRLPSALRADNGAMLAIRFDACCHKLICNNRSFVSVKNLGKIKKK